MKTKLLMAVAVTGLLGTGLYAFGGNMQGMQNGNCPLNGSGNPMMMKSDSRMGGFHIMRMLGQLNLTKEQMTKIDEIRDDMLKKRVTVDVAFTKDSFDKDKYIEIMKQKRDNMLESRAEMIDKVYKVLTSKQKEQLKVLIDLRKDRMLSMADKRMNFDKNCYGRR